MCVWLNTIIVWRRISTDSYTRVDLLACPPLWIGLTKSCASVEIEIRFGKWTWRRWQRLQWWNQSQFTGLLARLTNAFFLEQPWGIPNVTKCEELSTVSRYFFYLSYTVPISLLLLTILAPNLILVSYRTFYYLRVCTRKQSEKKYHCVGHNVRCIKPNLTQPFVRNVLNHKPNIYSMYSILLFLSILRG